MQAIILAGGLGTRLKSVVVDKPKALSPVAGKPFLHYILQYLQKQGVTEYVFSLGYLSEQVLDFLRENHYNLSFKHYVEVTPLGTGGGIKKAIEIASAKDVLVVNADTFFDVELQPMFTLHQTSNAACTISLKPLKNFDRYGSVEMDASQTITSFKEKQFTQQGLINGGYLILNKECYLTKTSQLPEVFSFEKDFLEANLQQVAVKGFVSNGYFIDIGIPEDYAKAQLVFADGTLVS